MSDLKKTQDALGRLHDIHVTQDLVRILALPGKRLGAEQTLLHGVLTAECFRLYAK